MSLTQCSCVLIIGGLVFILLYIFLLIYANHTLRKEERNSILNSFPYLYYQNMPRSARIFLYMILLMGVLFLGVGDCFFFSCRSYTTYQTILSFLFTIECLCLYCSNLLSLTYYKLHLISSILAFFFFAAGCLLTGLITFIGGAAINLYYNLPITIIIGVIGLLCFIALFNPKLTNWAKMQKTEEDGKVVYVRPKINYYAFYEWMCLGLNIVVSVLFLINLFITGL